VQLSFCPDEEIGGRTGFGWLAGAGRIKADFGMTEGLGYDAASCGNKGILWARIYCLGKTAHGSLPYKGINSFDGMLALSEELKRLEGRISKRTTRFDMINEADRHPTMVLGGELSGGKNANIVPSLSVFTVDRRIVPEESVSSARREIEGAIARAGRNKAGYRYKMKVIAQDSPVFVDPDEKICLAVKAAIERAIGKKARILLMPGGTDVRYLIKKGVPAVGYSARGSGRWHSVDEYIRVKSVLAAAKVYAYTIMGL
jgi:acetylornithine deacetylase/succinyl-diaminopimelate desuccinylase-like protein